MTSIELLRREVTAVKTTSLKGKRKMSKQLYSLFLRSTKEKQSSFQLK